MFATERWKALDLSVFGFSYTNFEYRVLGSSSEASFIYGDSLTVFEIFFQERVDCYPDVRIILKNPKNMSCQACELNRYCKFNVLLSGKLYNSKTLEADDFMSDDKQVISNKHSI